MFLFAMAKPRKIRQEDESEIWFDRKIGLWPCIQTSLAQRASINRPAGTQVIEPWSLIAEFYRELVCVPCGLIEKVRERMPTALGEPIYIQHDGAPNHDDRDNDD